jgi:hypothetical protein
LNPDEPGWNDLKRRSYYLKSGTVKTSGSEPYYYAQINSVVGRRKNDARKAHFLKTNPMTVDKH